MRRGGVWFTALFSGGLAWLAMPELRWPARLFAAMLLGPAPVLFMLRPHATAALPRPLPRLRIYVGSMIALWIMALLALLAGYRSGFRSSAMGLVGLPLSTYLIWTSLAVVMSGAVVALFKAVGPAETEIMRELTPVTPLEKAVFALLSLSAGVCEEVTFRGFLFGVLTSATTSLAGAVALSSLAFGMLHAHQSATGVLRATLVGALLAVPVAVTGSIYASMTAHAIVDIVGGLWLARWLFK